MLLLAALAAYLVFATLRRAPLRAGGFEFALPRPALDGRAARALDRSTGRSPRRSSTRCCRRRAGLSFGIVLGAYLLAQVVGLASHVPGGLGVFEGVMVLLLGP